MKRTIFLFGLLIIRDILSQTVDQTNATIIQSNSTSNTNTTTISTTTSSTRISSTVTSSTTTQTSAETTTSFSVKLATSVFWVQTILSMEVSEDIANISIRMSLESKLLLAYSEGYLRTVNIGRRKRAATTGVNTLYLVNVTRPTSTLKPTILVYYVLAPDFVSPSTVVSTMNKLSIQEMTLYMGRPVLVVAALYDSSAQSLSLDDKFWIFGAVFGSFAGAAFCIWLVLFVYQRCLIPVDEPLLAEKSQLDTGSETELRMHVEEMYKEDTDTQKLRYKQREDGGTGATIGSHASEKFPLPSNYNNERLEHTDNGNQFVIKDKYAYQSQALPNDLRNSSEKIRVNRGVHVSNVATRRSRHSNAPKRRKKRPRTLKATVSIESDVREETRTLEQASGLTNIGDTEQNEAVKQIVPTYESTNTVFVQSVEDQLGDRNDSDYEFIQPVAINDSATVKHIYPIYKDEIVIPDTTINLVQYSEAKKLEETRQTLNTASRKTNMRTFDIDPSVTT